MKNYLTAFIHKNDNDKARELISRNGENWPLNKWIKCCCLIRTGACAAAQRCCSEPAAFKTRFYGQTHPSLLIIRNQCYIQGCAHHACTDSLGDAELLMAEVETDHWDSPSSREIQHKHADSQATLPLPPAGSLPVPPISGRI